METKVEAEAEVTAKADAEAEADAAVKVSATILVLICGRSAVSRKRLALPPPLRPGFDRKAVAVAAATEGAL